MSFKHSLLMLIGLAIFLALILTACLSAPYAGADLTTISQDTVCRSGPGAAFSSITTLQLGETAQILAVSHDRAWWKIKAPLAVGVQCWVADPSVKTSGDLTHVPVAPNPVGRVTSLAIHGPPVIHSDCETDEETNPITFNITITTDGPATVTYHLEVYNFARTMLLEESPNATRTFASASTQTFDPGIIYRTDCGNFVVEMKVSSPNTMTEQTTWSVVSP
jgi:uncharacterized protein YraI